MFTLLGHLLKKCQHMSNSIFKLCSYIQKNRTNPNTVFKITIYNTKYTKHVNMHFNVSKNKKLKVGKLKNLEKYKPTKKKDNFYIIHILYFIYIYCIFCIFCIFCILQSLQSAAHKAMSVRDSGVQSCSYLQTFAEF